ncbi:hypothetical protein A0123_01570 [Gluconobacter cerinus]|uniref:Uncharacterized protein n=1 Tax=Gluconobacter cerinus TaxID=38307 RepID=A0A1B6VJX5_9PROT|nr:hypothetical protein A0123_01570 [Gluconobacter cerinus]
MRPLKNKAASSETCSSSLVGEAILVRQIHHVRYPVKERDVLCKYVDVILRFII